MSNETHSIVPVSARRGTAKDLNSKAHLTDAYHATNDPIGDGEFDDVLYPLDMRDVRGLFASVALEQWRIAFDLRVNDTHLEQRQARAWFGSEGFHEVCYLAGVCGHSIYRKFKARAAGEFWGKKQYGSEGVQA
jgi:hypothetical protein